MKSRILVSIGIIFILMSAGFVGATIFDNDKTVQAYKTDNLIRLHVLANSDSIEDQELKLNIKERILKETGLLFLEATDTIEARRLIEENLDYIEEIVRQEIGVNGKDYGVEVYLDMEPFPETSYGSLTLPEGDYEALKVVIGKGNGLNWWCVLFPPLCFTDPNGDDQVFGYADKTYLAEEIVSLSISGDQGETTQLIAGFKSKSSIRIMNLLKVPFTYIRDIFSDGQDSITIGR